MTVRECLLDRHDLGDVIASSASFREALVKLGIPVTKNGVWQLGIFCEERGIDVGHIRNKKKHADITSTCPECGKQFANKTSGKESKTWCTQKCANVAQAKTRDQATLNQKIAAGLTKSLGAIARSRGHADQSISCEICGKIFTVERRRRHRKFCSKPCASSATGKKYGSIIGRLSAQKMVRRSKNEILFSEMCAEKWAIVCNEPMFDGWDADVVIPELKIAVLWNGIWHYKDKIRPGHSLLQVQTRDQIKLKVIERHGYKSYVVKDMGRHNPKFVKEEFDKFVEWCKKTDQSFPPVA